MSINFIEKELSQNYFNYLTKNLDKNTKEVIFYPIRDKNKKESLKNKLMQMSEIIKRNPVSQMSFPMFVSKDMDEMYKFFVENLEELINRDRNDLISEQEKNVACYLAIQMSKKIMFYKDNLDKDLTWKKFFIAPRWNEKKEEEYHSVFNIIKDDLEKRFFLNQSRKTIIYTYLIKDFVELIKKYRENTVLAKDNEYIDYLINSYIVKDIDENDITFHEQSFSIAEEKMPLIRWQQEILAKKRENKKLKDILQIIENLNYLPNLKENIKNLKFQIRDNILTGTFVNIKDTDLKQSTKDLIYILKIIEDLKINEVEAISKKEYSTIELSKKEHYFVTRFIQHRISLMENEEIINYVNSKIREDELNKKLRSITVTNNKQTKKQKI